LWVAHEALEIGGNDRAHEQHERNEHHEVRDVFLSDIVAPQSYRAGDIPPWLCALGLSVRQNT
jgi:hypothetical protein